MRAALLLVLPLVLAGCTAPESLGFARESPSPEPYYKEHREILDGEHARAYEVPVLHPARAVNVTAHLDARTNGLPLPSAMPARLTVSLLSPEGETLREAQLDAQRPEASLLVEDATQTGTWFVKVEGFGASRDVDGQRYGAGYKLTVEVLYPATGS